MKLLRIEKHNGINDYTLYVKMVDVSESEKREIINHVESFLMKLRSVK